jgi:hypothetical protein
MKKTEFKKTTGVVIAPIRHLNFGQTVDVVDEASDEYIIQPHGDKSILSVPKNCVQLYDTIYDVPCILNPRFSNEN